MSNIYYLHAIRKQTICTEKHLTNTGIRCVINGERKGKHEIFINTWHRMKNMTWAQPTHAHNTGRRDNIKSSGNKKFLINENIAPSLNMILRHKTRKTFIRDLSSTNEGMKLKLLTEYRAANHQCLKIILQTSRQKNGGKYEIGGQDSTS